MFLISEYRSSAEEEPQCWSIGCTRQESSETLRVEVHPDHREVEPSETPENSDLPSLHNGFQNTDNQNIDRGTNGPLGQQIPDLQSSDAVLLPESHIPAIYTVMVRLWRNQMKQKLL